MTSNFSPNICEFKPSTDFWLNDKDNSVMQLFLSGHRVFKDKYRGEKNHNITDTY